MTKSLFISQDASGHFIVEPAHSSTPIHTATTQEGAIIWAKKNHANNPLHAARVPELHDKKIPSHWRKV
ncbi:hypothetical protein LT85_2961 [Collimonas arenae]|uniref:Uncharacterized protein n=1 Tax=Collimonas arenae TaxID=279058 RepID=A0A0A1FEM0_9BURK|nr:hypothetical protein [Collimonas arenae]AIY42119.1 hypothetical protein LT85_2961 [Collimonas arenae]